MLTEDDKKKIAEELRIANRKANLDTILWGVYGFSAIIALYLIQRYLLGGEFLGNYIVAEPHRWLFALWTIFVLFIPKRFFGRYNQKYVKALLILLGLSISLLYATKIPL